MVGEAHRVATPSGAIDTGGPALTGGRGEGDGTTPDRPLSPGRAPVRNNRQLSPNQTGLWTVYELIDSQACWSRDHSTPALSVRRAGPGDLGRVLAMVVRRVVERLGGRALTWPRLGPPAVVRGWSIKPSGAGGPCDPHAMSGGQPRSTAGFDGSSVNRP